MKNEQGYTALHVAVDEDLEESFEFLISFYKDVNVLDKEGVTPLHCAIL